MTPATLPQIAIAAVQSERATGIPASVTAAQCIQESGWLSHAPGNNCFGIKAHGSWPSQTIITTEVIWPKDRQPQDVVLNVAAGGKVRIRGPRLFCAYPTLKDCFDDHANLLLTNPRYAPAVSAYRINKDAESFARAIAPIYATDTDYATEIITLMRQQNVVAAIQAARVAP